MCGGVLQHAASGSPELQCIAAQGFFYDSKAGHMYNLLNIYTTNSSLKVEGRLTITIDSTMSARLLSVALDLFSSAFVACSSYTPSLLHRCGRPSWL
jgi:hypothetical protein